MSIASDNFEKFVHRIHELVETPDSQVVWNDHVPDPDNPKQPRQIDVATPERNAAAWKQSFAVLNEVLGEKTSSSVIYIMIGCQASGKSTWARRKCAEDGAAIIFDAILVKQTERVPILRAAAHHEVLAVAVWFQTPLQVCLQRNTARRVDEAVNEQGLRNVFNALEPPQLSEGFLRVVEVKPVDA